MITVVPYQSAMAAEVLAVWQAALGDRHPIMPELWTANTSGDPHFSDTDALVALSDGRPIGFALTKRLRHPFPGCERYASVGWIALLAVHPDHQGQGAGRQLLSLAEAHLRHGGCTRIVLGGSFHHFLAGVPDTTAPAYFAKAGYTLGASVWDVRRRLQAAPRLPDVTATLAAAPDVTIRPLRSADVTALGTFLAGQFPGRWHRDVDWYLQHDGSPAMVMGLFSDSTVKGFAHLHPPGSSGSRRWAGTLPGVAALGPIGVADDQRGRGLGLALLVRGLEALQHAGADETVIDWTDLLDFYGRCDFRPWLAYRLMDKALT